MATLHLICGYMGFGKTTISRKLGVRYNAVVLNDDEIMIELLGRNPPEEVFRPMEKRIESLTWKLAEKIISSGTSVILDKGFWSRQSRQEALERARIFCHDIQFHQIECDLEVAKRRVLKRNDIDENALEIEENTFNLFLDKYEPLSSDEGLNVLYYNNTLEGVNF